MSCLKLSLLTEVQSGCILLHCPLSCIKKHKLKGRPSTPKMIEILYCNTHFTVMLTLLILALLRWSGTSL